MYEHKNIGAIILARGGSKGLPRKNVKPLLGKPLLAWSIEQAKMSKYIDRVFVSTEDREIADISLRYGAEVIQRPDELATDTSSSESALLRAMDFIRDREKFRLDIVVFLQPTSPVRESEDIDNAIGQFFTQGVDSLFSCTEIRDYSAWEEREGNYFNVNYHSYDRRPRQHIKPRYLENGSIYIFKPEVIRKYKNRLGGKVGIYEMPFWKSFQIDSLDELEICEYYLRKLLAGK